MATHTRIRVSSIERRRVHLSACKCVHRWSITGRDAADCRMFIGHRISCYSAYYYGTMDRVARRREEKRKEKKKGRERERREENDSSNIFLFFLFFFLFFFFPSSGRRFPCPVARGLRAHLGRAVLRFDRNKNDLI